MNLITIYRISKTALVSFWRNLWLSLAATLIMTLTLVTIAVFVSLLVVTNKTTDNLRDKADLTVYFNDSATEDQVFAIQSILSSRQDVKEVKYISKSDALVKWRERTEGEEIQAIVSESDNPLPRSLEVKTTAPEYLESVNQYLSSDDHKTIVREISYRENKALVDRLVKITSFIKIFGYSISLVFVLIAILIIYNTVRLTIFARSDEIEIMKLVGASDLYVRGPFVIEGIAYGLLGAIISSSIFYFLFRLFIPVAERYLEVSNVNSTYLGMNITIITLVQFAVGLILGGFCSVVAIRKHLK